MTTEIETLSASVPTGCKLWKVRDVLKTFPTTTMSELEPVPYNPSLRRLPPLKLMLASNSLQHHMTNEGHQLQQGLSEAGYKLVGHGFQNSSTDLADILKVRRIGTIIVQDRREWTRKEFPQELFRNTDRLRSLTGCFKLTVLKDAHQTPVWNRHNSWDIGCHAWIVYYNTRIVSRLAPFVRPQHLIRTWHTVDPDQVPEFVPAPQRRKAILSGALSSAYPYRLRLYRHNFKGVDKVQHPGYTTSGTRTPDYLKTLSQYKVSICTSSKYGYALRKIIESVACGCIVVTDLPVDEFMPLIEPSIVRVRPGTDPQVIQRIIDHIASNYDDKRQRAQAREAVAFYNYVGVTKRLAFDIEQLRRTYNAPHNS